MLGLRFLQPRLCLDIPPAARSAYLQFYKTAAFSVGKVPGSPRTITSGASRNQSKKLSNTDIDPQDGRERRLRELKEANALEYPRIKKSLDVGYREMTCQDYLRHYSEISSGTTVKEDNIVLRGRYHRTIFG